MAHQAAPLVKAVEAALALAGQESNETQMSVAMALVKLHHVSSERSGVFPSLGVPLVSEVQGMMTRMLSGGVLDPQTMESGGPMHW